VTGANLVFVAGASPQIITETVSALAVQGTHPSRVFVLTTETGRAVIARELFGRPGHWKRVTREYPTLRDCDFSRHDITVLRDDRGKPLVDVRSPTDSTAAGDQIVDFVAERTRKGRPPLYASIAGGRKTMGYLLAAAMMMYGRREDRLSHVLVHPPELEGTDFFFLPRRPAGMLTYRKPDRRTVRVSAADVRVELADLPFLRLRALTTPPSCAAPRSPTSWPSCRPTSTLLPRRGSR
jgi:CRISPR-associated protein (TIGR02584 family)